jgi:hypothetical protein
MSSYMICNSSIDYYEGVFCFREVVLVRTCIFNCRIFVL